MLYERLDRLRAETSRELAEVRRRAEGRTHQARSERDVAAAWLEKRRSELLAVENTLCFGRLDYPTRASTWAGSAFSTSRTTTAHCCSTGGRPAARSFYTATGVHNEGVLRRRHLRIEGRTVVRVDDEVFDFAGVEQRGDAIVGERRCLPPSRRVAPIGCATSLPRSSVTRIGSSGRHWAVCSSSRAARHWQDRGCPAPGGLPALFTP
jgi:hypothetical protein